MIGVSAAIGGFVGGLIGFLFNLIIQERKYKYDLSMVALEKKLEAHQKAYTLFFRIRNYPTGDALEIYNEGVSFIRNYSLYLNKEAFEAIQCSLKQLQKCVQLNNNAAMLSAELKILEEQGEKIRNSLQLPKIELSDFNAKL